MVASKTEEFKPEYQRLAILGRVLSHPARIAILAALAERKSCICAEIVEVLPLAQSTVSQHLQVLKEAGLIEGEVMGPRSCYCINWRELEESIRLFGEVFGGLCFTK